MPQESRNSRERVPDERTNSNSSFEPQSSGTQRRPGARNWRSQGENTANVGRGINGEHRVRQPNSRRSERPATLNHAQTDPTLSTHGHSSHGYGGDVFDGNEATDNHFAHIGNVHENRDNPRFQVNLTTINSPPTGPEVLRTQAPNPNPFRSNDRMPEDNVEEVARDGTSQYRNTHTRSGPQYGPGDFRSGEHPSRGFWSPSNATRWGPLWDSGAPITEHDRAAIQAAIKAGITAEFDRIFKTAAPREVPKPQPGLAPEFLVLLGVGITLPFFTFLALKR